MPHFRRAGLWQPAGGGAADGAADALYAGSGFDLDDRARDPEGATVGADEIGETADALAPLAAVEVGPAWLQATVDWAASVVSVRPVGKLAWDLPVGSIPLPGRLSLWRGDFPAVRGDPRSFTVEPLDDDLWRVSVALTDMDKSGAAFFWEQTSAEPEPEESNP